MLVATSSSTGSPAVTRGLSHRQRQVLAALTAGMAENQVAAGLGISQHTVHIYVKALYRRFGVSSRSELLARWIARVPDLTTSAGALAPVEIEEFSAIGC